MHRVYWRSLGLASSAPADVRACGQVRTLAYNYASAEPKVKKDPWLDEFGKRVMKGNEFWNCKPWEIKWEQEHYDILNEVMRESTVCQLDLTGRKLVAKAVGQERGETLYDLGLARTIRTPKPMHLTSVGSGNRNLAVTPEDMLSGVDFIGKEKFTKKKQEFNTEVILGVTQSELLEHQGDLMPTFTDVERGDKHDMFAVTWKVLFDAHKNKKLVQGRLLNSVHGGFAVAFGPLVGFLPNSHLSNAMRSPQHPKWETKIPTILGKKMWFVVLDLDQQNKNIVVSHKFCPRESQAQTLTSGSSPRRGKLQRRVVASGDQPMVPSWKTVPNIRGVRKPPTVINPPVAAENTDEKPEN
uniref:S1 motif domain-containing protein n=1 Tax=Mucochytrium quahogii TaxID=96639 RepID=A0A7S2W7M1_9STRA|mmetsp:Transcript_2926/g.4203  ORF Transcript_2926/g.4203 Transcript_2926/m.4203 type:complete len:355 (+) Transcript_2926:54-1118(+)